MSPPLSISTPSSRTIGLGLLGGLVHVALAGGIWLWFGFTTRIQGSELFLVYTLIGAVLLGLIPTVLLVMKGLGTPILTVGGLGLGAAYQTWSVYVTPETPPAPVDPTPFGWYLLGWVVVLAVALVMGGGESGLRHLRSDHGNVGSLLSNR